METLLKSIEKEISNSLSTIKNIQTNGNKIEYISKKIECFGIELERLNNVIVTISNEYNRLYPLSKSEAAKLKEFIDNSMSDFLKKSGVPGINTNYKFDTKLL